MSARITYTRLKKIIDTLEEQYGEERSGSNGKMDLMDVLIATKLSQNTTDKTSFIAFKNLKDNFKSWEDVMNAPVSKIRNLIKVCGLANTKAAQIKEILKNLHKEHGTLSLNRLKKLSDDEVYDELLQHKGLGKKTVSCLLAFGMNRNVFPVDTHVHRILNRIGIVETNTPDETFEKAKTVIPDEDKVSFHVNLIRFGREVCKAPAPLCGECMISKLCAFKQKNFNNGKNSKPVKNNFIILENI